MAKWFMKNNKAEFLIWIERAKDDLLWTEANIREKIYYGACFTSQQAVEKALKAFLLYREGQFGKIHDLVKLIDECIVLDKSFNDFRKKISKLTFYYIQTRYPDISELDKYSKEEADEALLSAREIVDFVYTILKS